MTRKTSGLLASLLILAACASPVSQNDPPSGSASRAVQAAISSAVYYVDSVGGNDSNSGTSTSTPWKTLAKVGSMTYGAGAQILLKSGDAWNETLTISNSNGTSASPITLSSYGTGSKPIIRRNTANTDICVMINDASYWNISNLLVENAAEGIVMHYTTAGHTGISFSNCDFQQIYGIQYPGVAINGVNYTFSSGICFAGSFGSNGPLVSNITVQGCTTSNGAAELFLISAVDSITGYCVQNVNLSNCNTQGGVFGYWLHCVDGGTATNMVATNNGVQAFKNGPCAVGIERSRNFTFTSCEFSYCQRQGSNPDGCGLDFEGGDVNVSVQNCTFKYNAGAGLYFYTKTGGSSNCVVNGCTFTNDGVNAVGADNGDEVKVIYGTQTGHQLTNNQYTVRTAWNFTNATTGFTLTNNNASGAYEAEKASLLGGAKVDTNHTGYSGTGFVDGYNMVAGASTKFTVNVSGAGSKTVSLRYSSGFMTCTNVDLYLNGTKIKTITCPQTTDWNTWGIETETLSLNNGSSTIEYRSNSNQTNNCINLDYITVT